MRWQNTPQIAKWRTTLYWLLSSTAILLLVVWALVYWLTDHPKAVQAAEFSCSDEAQILQTNTPLKVLNWNVQYMAGRGYEFFHDDLEGGPDKRPSSADIARTIDEVATVIAEEAPDIVLLQEIDRGSKRTDYGDQAALLQKALAKHEQAYPCQASAYYHKVKFLPHPQIMGSVSMSLLTLSKYQINKATRYALPPICGDPLTVAFNLKRAVLATSFTNQQADQHSQQATFTAFNTHLDAFAQDCNTMQQQVSKVKEILQNAKGNWLIGGDFNLLASRQAYQRLKPWQQAYYQPNSELDSLTASFRSFPSVSQVNSNIPKYYTHFPNSHRATAADRSIDYFFYSPQLTVSNERVRQDNPKISDHYALISKVMP